MQKVAVSCLEVVIQLGWLRPPTQYLTRLHSPELHGAAHRCLDEFGGCLALVTHGLQLGTQFGLDSQSVWRRKGLMAGRGRSPGVVRRVRWASLLQPQATVPESKSAAHAAAGLT